MISLVSRRRWVLAVLVVSCATALSACDEAIGPVAVVRTNGVARLVAITPTQLLAQFGVVLDTPIRVRVLDESGRPVASATVKYSVLSGSGVFSADSTITNDQGFTEVTFRPTSAGTVVIEARVERPPGAQRIQFTILVLNDPTIATRFEKVSGDNQSGVVGTELPSPLVVRLLNADGFPVASKSVTFAVQVTHGDTLAGVAAGRGGPFLGQVTVVSDSSGFAQAFARLGTQSDVYTFTASAIVVVNGRSETRIVGFTATALASGRIAQLIPISGFNQTAVIDTIHEREDTLNFRGRDPQPMVLQAVDRFGNPVVGATIRWFVSDGGGRLLFTTTTTDVNGLTSNTIFDVTEGRNAVVAFVPGAPALQFVINVTVYVPPEESGGGGGGG